MTDLFGHKPAQGSLFGDSEDRLEEQRVSDKPNPTEIRQRLKSVIDEIKGVETMPWSENEARVWQMIFPNMIKCLPEKEGQQLKFEFEQEIKRLLKAA